MESFIGQIIMFGGNFAPRSWAFCHGQLLAIAQNTALYSVLGITYGGDGQTTFGLPDMRGRVAISPGHGSGLSNYRLGRKAGSETAGPLGASSIYAEEANSSYTGVTETYTGSNQPVPNLEPYLAVHYILCLQGTLPSRS